MLISQITITSNFDRTYNVFQGNGKVLKELSEKEVFEKIKEILEIEFKKFSN